MSEDRSRERIEVRLKHLEQLVGSLSDRLSKLEEERERDFEFDQTAPDETAASPPPLPHLPEPENVRPETEDPVPVVPSREEAADVYEEEPTSGGLDWRGALREWHLWPPEGEGSMEVQLGAWWSTRIGALLAVIGVVFFAVYVAQNTAPWVRFLQLCAVAIAVTGAGHWLERRNERFGAVIFSAGLALVFFSAFAAYALPAVRVIEDTLLAGLVQGVVVAGIVVCSLWKDRSSLATLAVIFGFVTCFFSFGAGLQNFSLFAAGLLGAAAVVFHGSRGWTAPFAVAVPFAYLLIILIVEFGWDEAVPAYPLFLLPAAAFFVLFAAGDFVGCRSGVLFPLGHHSEGRLPAALGGKMPPLIQIDSAGSFRLFRQSLSQRRFVIGVNLGGALAAGFWAARELSPDNLEWFYLGMAVIVGAFSFIAYRRDRADWVPHVYFAAATALLALFFVESLDARTRWLALGIQSIVTMVAVRQTKLRGTEAMMWLVWGGSVWCFFVDTANAGLFQDSTELFSLWGLTAGGYLILSAVLAGVQAKLLGTAPLCWQPRGIELPEEERVENRVRWNAGVCLVLGALGGGVSVALFSGEWLAAGAMLVTLLLAVVSAVTRQWLPVCAAGLPFALGQLVFWRAVQLDLSVDVVAFNGLAAVGIPLLLLMVFHRLAAHIPLPVAGKMGIGVALAGCCLVSFQVLTANVVSVELYFMVSAGISLFIAAIASRLAFDYLGDIVWLPVLLGVAAPLFAGLEEFYMFPGEGPVWFYWAGAFAAVAVAVLHDCWGRLRERMTWMAEAEFLRLLPGGIAVIAVLYPIGKHLPEPSGLVGVIIFGMLFSVLGWKSDWRRSSWTGGLVFLVGTFAGVMVPLLREGIIPVVAAVGTGVAGVAYVVILARLTRETLVAKKIWGGVVSLAVLGMLFVLAVTRPEPALSYATIFWGVSAAALLVTGLVFRVAALRVVGLIGLALCLPRAFLVDIHSMYYRIAAFAGLGVAMLIVGYLYHRFRHLILPPEDPD